MCHLPMSGFMQAVETEDKLQNKTEAALQTASAACEPAPKQTMSKGEKWFDWITYRGLNYWVNLIGSVAIADFFKHGKGKPFLERRINGLTGTLTKMGMSPQSAHDKTKASLDYLALTSGGWILLWPLKQLEDRKRRIVHWLNKKFGVDQTAPDGHELTPEEIHLEKEQPHQSGWTVVGRRALASLSVLAAGHAVDYTFATKKTDGTNIKGTDVVTDFIMTGSDKKGGLNRVLQAKYAPPGSKWLATNPGAQRWLRLGALDSVFTQITAVVMWMTRGAKDEAPKPKNKQESAPLAASPIRSDLQERGTTKSFAEGHAHAPTHAERLAATTSSSIELAHQGLS